MAKAENHLSEFLRSLTFFSGLPDTDINAFLGAANVRTFAKGEGLFHPGRRSQFLFRHY